jgi:hypothetical protein
MGCRLTGNSKGGSWVPLKNVTAAAKKKLKYDLHFR